MKNLRFTESQIVSILNEAEVGIFGAVQARRRGNNVF